MTCFFCKGTLEEAVTTHLEQRGAVSIIIKNVPCMRCTQCGEVVYNGKVAQRIEQLTDGFDKAGTEIVVSVYSAA